MAKGKTVAAASLASNMSLRLVLVCLAILAVAYAQPAPGAPIEAIERSEPVEGTLVAPIDEAKPRTLVMLLPLLFPNAFYFS